MIRLSDRVEALSVLAVAIVAIFSIQLAAQLGASTYDTQMRMVHEQSADRHPVRTEVVDGNAGIAADPGNPGYVRVEWRDGTRLRTEQVVSADIVEPGAALTIWLDQKGHVVAAPLTPSDAAVTSFAVEGTVWVTCVLLSAIGAALVRIGLDRFRNHGWERDLRLLTSSDDGWANRHP